MDITIRKALPEDVDRAVPLILSSGPDAFNYIFTHKTQLSASGFLHRVFVTGKGQFGFQNHYVVMLDNKVVGAGTAYSREDMLGFTVVALKQFFSSYGLLKGLGVIRRGLLIERLLPPPTSNMHYISHLGVDPEFQGRGIGRQLIEHLFDVGRSQGRTLAALDVSVLNPRAEALYTRMGFVVVDEYESRLENATAKVPSHRRMELDLTK